MHMASVMAPRAPAVFFIVFVVGLLAYQASLPTKKQQHQSTVWLITKLKTTNARCRPMRRKCHLKKVQADWLCLLLILLAGDIELNPGPLNGKYNFFSLYFIGVYYFCYQDHRFFDSLFRRTAGAAFALPVKK